jgi:hypothetical protein
VECIFIYGDILIYSDFQLHQFGLQSNMILFLINYSLIPKTWMVYMFGARYKSLKVWIKSGRDKISVALNLPLASANLSSADADAPSYSSRIGSFT